MSQHWFPLPCPSVLSLRLCRLSRFSFYFRLDLALHLFMPTGARDLHIIDLEPQIHDPGARPLNAKSSAGLP